MLCVQVHVNLVSSPATIYAPLTPSCISVSPPETNLGIFTEGNLLLYCISNLPLGVTNEGREAIKLISGAVVGDSNLQDRGVAHSLLSLLFSLVSLSFSFYFLSLIKNTKNTCYLSCVFKYVRSWYYEGIRGLGFPSKERGKYEEGMGQNF